jgi:hypothetical protein
MDGLRHTHTHTRTSLIAILRTNDTVKSIIFWGMTPCSLTEVHRRFRGTYCLLLHGSRLSRVSSQQEAGGRARRSAYSSALKEEAVRSS